MQAEPSTGSATELCPEKPTLETTPHPPAGEGSGIMRTRTVAFPQPWEGHVIATQHRSARRKPVSGGPRLLTPGPRTRQSGGRVQAARAPVPGRGGGERQGRPAQHTKTMLVGGGPLKVCVCPPH